MLKTLIIIGTSVALIIVGVILILFGHDMERVVDVIDTIENALFGMLIISVFVIILKY